ncbi:flagellar basal-body rod protein FlgG [Herbaspirillum rubrisubalbicans]|uniref:flagellar basal-body rod protein FlgG n=1 Tax=Herbaspirillum rubrisubalbicans TaxID=80842 RepID=UPI000DC46765|nr:flagellar basal-body rod protein FlgG [Herbaspirillum rubrisubalbicans]RAN48437.1 flagellar basal-body rod protein FlgG [Herbaspirillum rubrisubalbicans]
MLDSLYIAATGMQAQQLNVDTIANNLTNLNTATFKKGRVSFTDLVDADAQRLGPAGLAASTPSTQGTGPLSRVMPVGVGVGVASVGKLFDTGTITATGSSWDLAINGDGFIEVTMPDGSLSYTRGGTLKVNSDGMLVTQSGYPLKPGIAVPTNATSLTISSNGAVTAAVPNQINPVNLGQLQLARFTNPGGLAAQGSDLYVSTDASGEPIAANAGQDGLGTLVQGSLEASNVKLVDEMVNLMVAQRAYEANVKVAQASDEMLGLINNLRK